MVDIPSAIQIQALICPGRTYLFKADEHKSDKKHFHVVLNRDPKHDAEIVLVTATSIDFDQCSDYWSDLVRQEVIVQAIAGDADFIKHPTMFRCDKPLLKTKSLIMQKLELGLLKQLDLVPEELLNKLRQGVLNSETVSEDIKALIRF